MLHERISLNRDETARLLSCGIRFFLAAALSASRLFDGYAPFALGCVAAAGAGAEGLAALLGTGLGTLLFLNFSSGLPHLAAAALIFALATAFHGLKLLDRPLFVPISSAALFFAVKLIYLLQTAGPMTKLYPCLTASLLVAVSARCYVPLFHPGQEKSLPDAAAFLAVTLLVAFSDLKLGGLSVGRAAVSCLVLYIAYQRGAAVGTAAGLCAGLAMDLAGGGGALLFAGAYGFGGFLAGTRSKRSRLSAAGCWVLATLLLLLYVANAVDAALLEEMLLAAPVFLLLPARLFGGKRVKKAQEAELPSAMESLKAHLTQTAAAFRDLYDSLGRGTGNSTDENPAIVFDRAAEKTCRSCALCSLCWQKEYTSTFNALNDATPFLLERGRALPKDFPPYFTDRCIHLTDFLTAINGELSAYLLRRQYRKQLEETRRSARGQYAQLSDLLSATAANLGEAQAVSGEAGRSYRIGAALRPKDGENVCGDSVSSFETEGGLLCLLLSDGMGSGEAARRESALTSRLVRQFLQAGVGAEAAIKTLNAALSLRSAEFGGFSTVDLLTMQRKTGEVVLYKYGAAPSYVKRGGNVRRITGAALPAGLRDTPTGPDVTKFPAESGSFIILISDGVADALHDEWLQNLLAGWEEKDPQMLASLILSESAKYSGLSDDCGVQVLYLPEEEPGRRKKV